MVIRSKTLNKVVTIALVVSLSQVYVHANLTKDGATNGAAATTKAGGRLTGRLTADGPVAVNGNKARTGDTIFPGATIETPAGAGATVQLGALGQLDLSPNTSLTLSFDQGNIQGELVKGCAILSANRGVNGTLALPRGVMKRTEGAGNTVSACADGTGNELATGAKTARMGRNGINLGGSSVSWYELGSLLAGSGVLTGGIRMAGAQDSGAGGCCCCCNPSPSAPPQ
jgi:hypothetical protein